MTRLLATLHAHANYNSEEDATANAADVNDTNADVNIINADVNVTNADANVANANINVNNADVNVRTMTNMSKCPAKMTDSTCLIEDISEGQCNGECGDRLTSEITNLDSTSINIQILSHFLSNFDTHSNIVRQLNNLDSDIGTLLDFIKFSSAVCKKWVASVGPIGISDVWICKDPQQGRLL